eukprot:839312-Pyramimonas_sp.AAC.1
MPPPVGQEVGHAASPRLPGGELDLARSQFCHTAGARTSAAVSCDPGGTNAHRPHRGASLRVGRPAFSVAG